MSALGHKRTLHSSFDQLLRWRDEGFPFFNDINHVQFDGLISRTFVVNAAVGKCYGLPYVEDLFRLPVHVQPEVTLYDMCHYHARMAMAAGLETGGDLELHCTCPLLG